MSKIITFSNASTPVVSLLNDARNESVGGLDLQPNYQRGFIWSRDFKDKLIFSVIRKYPAGSISIRQLDSKNGKGASQEVVDGQQRIKTIRDFVENGYKVKGECARKIIESIVDFLVDSKIEDDIKKTNKLKNRLSNTTSISIGYKDLPVTIQRNIDAYEFAVSKISNASDDQIREYFRFLQNQERLRAGEIIKSMPATNLEVYLNQIKNKQLFLDLIGFKDNRKEFDKIFYSIIGLVDGKINFGMSDRKIQNYAWTAKTPTTGLRSAMLLINQINLITSRVLHPIIKASRKRFLKYLLLLSTFGYVDFSHSTEIKIRNLKEIDDKLPVFFSAKVGAVENEFKGATDKNKEDLRNIALVAKGAQNIERVKNRMQILAFYVNNGYTKNIESPTKISLI